MNDYWKNHIKCYIYIINYQNRVAWHDLLRNNKETEQQADHYTNGIRWALDISFATVNRCKVWNHEPTTKIKRKIVQLCKENNIKVELE